MAEPISIMTGVAGLIKNSYAIIKLIDSVRSAPAQAAAAAAEITETRTILRQLQNFLLRFETADKSRTAQVQVDQLVDAISGCMVTFSDFEAALDKIAGSSMTLVGRAKWAVWDEEKIAGLIARLQRHKISLSVVVIILTGETQIDIRDSLERLHVAVDGLQPPEDTESVTSRKTTVSRAGLGSDTSSIVTVIHSPQDPALIPDKRFHYEFEPELKRSRPYRKMSLEATTSAISIAETKMRGWSVLSGCSLADVTNISVVSLTISLSELHNPKHYGLPGEQLSPVNSKPPEGEVFKQQARQNKEKGLRLKDTWNMEIAILRAGRYKDQGRLAEAENMYRRVLDINERMLGEEHKSTLNTVLDLARLYKEQYQWMEAEAMYKRALAGSERVLGSEHKSTFTTVYNLGLVYDKQDKLVEAEAMFQRALAGRKKILGPEHESTLTTVHNLGYVYDKQDKLVEAEALYKRALAGYEKIFGPEHESTLTTVHNLGNVYNKQDKLVEAEAMFQRALSGREKALGPEHESTLATVHGLGYVYNKQDKLVEAEATYKWALAGREKLLGPDHESTLYTIHTLGLIYRKQGKLVEAEAVFRRALDSREHSLGPQNVLVLDVVCELGHLYAKHENQVEAEGMYRRSLDGYEKALGPVHLSSLTTVTCLGLLLAKQDKKVEAEGLFRRALDGFGKVTRPEHKSTSVKVNSYTFYRDYQWKLDETEAICRQILDGHGKDIGLEQSLIRDMLNKMEQLHRK